MTTTYVGELTIEAVIPGVAAPLVAAMADIQAKVDAMAAFTAQLGLPPVPLVAQLSIANSIVAALEVSIYLGLEAPSIDAQLSIALAALAQLEAELAIYTTLFSLLASGGVFVYAVDAATNAVGGELSVALATGFPGHGATDHANVLVLGTVSGATWASMQLVFQTT
jgi:hypothetical protein